MSTLAPDDPSKIVITTPDSGVTELQRVLTAYAQVTGYTPANPGPIDGIVGLRTAMAVIAMLPRVPGIPSEVTSLAPVLSLMLATEDGKAQVFGLIRRNATSISRAVIATEAYRVATGGNVQQPPPPPVPGGGKASWALVSAAAAIAPNSVWAPPSAAGGTTAPDAAIWFWDGLHPFKPERSMYRIAVPRGTLSGSYSNYVEIAPSMSKPNSGTEVSRGAFYSAIGQWWKTPLGMAAVGVGAVGATFAAYKGARLLMR